MTIPQPPNLEPTSNFVKIGPNDDTDGTDRDTETDFCACGHAKSDHEPLKRPDLSQPTWQCLYCACTRAYPMPAPATH